jgi:hypothetical protein
MTYSDGSLDEWQAEFSMDNPNLSHEDMVKMNFTNAINQLNL